MSNNVKVKMVEWFNKHWYKLELENKEIRWIPSVTTKLNILDKPFLRKWVGELGLREADMRLFEAQERGTRIHSAFEVFQRGGAVIYQPWQRPNYTEEEIEEIKKRNALSCIVKYQDEILDVLKLSKFFDVVKPEVLMTEGTVYSLDDNDAGTVDAIYRIKEGDYMVNGSKPLHISGGVYVVDLKTGSTIDKNAYRQTAAYVNCVKKMGLYEPVGTMILHTQSKNSKGIEGLGVHLREGSVVQNDYKEYRLASELWQAEHGDDTPRVFEFPSLIQLEAK